MTIISDCLWSSMQKSSKQNRFGNTGKYLWITNHNYIHFFPSKITHILQKKKSFIRFSWWALKQWRNRRDRGAGGRECPLIVFTGEIFADLPGKEGSICKSFCFVLFCFLLFTFWKHKNLLWVYQTGDFYREKALFTHGKNRLCPSWKYFSYATALKALFLFLEKNPKY